MNNITVAICTYRRYDMLKKCLDVLLKLNHPLEKINLVIVDNSLQPTEGTAFRNSIVGFPNLHYYITEKSGLSYARNFALEKCETEFIAFIDDDSMVDANWANSLCVAIDRWGNQLGAIGGKVNPIWTVERPEWLADKLLGALTVLDMGVHEFEVNYDKNNWLVGANIIFNANAVRQVGGFSEKLGRNQGNLICHEEMELNLRLQKAGFKIIYNPQIIVNHYIHAERVNKEFICKLMYSEGISRGLLNTIDEKSIKNDMKYLLDCFLDPNLITEKNLFSDINNPQYFAEKVHFISLLGRLIYQARLVFDQAPDWCFIPTNNYKPLTFNNKENLQSDENIPINKELTINGLLNKPIYKQCSYIKAIWFVIPCLNAANTINNTLDSIFSQEGDFTLYLHVQDGKSTDGTIEIVEHWRNISRQRKTGPTIIMTVDSSKDSGLYNAINKGFEYLNVPDDGFMTWLNADDVLKPKSLITIVEIARRYQNIHWVCGNRSVMTEEGEIVRESSTCENIRYSIMYGICDKSHNEFIQQEGSFWRGWLWKQAGGVNQDFKLAGDYDLWIRFARYAELYPVNKPLATFRFRKGSLSSNMDGYLTEIDQVMPFKEREENYKKLIVLLSEGYIMLSPQIKVDERDFSMSIAWNNSILNVPMLKDELRKYHQSLAKYSEFESTDFRNIHKEKNIQYQKLPHIPSFDQSKGTIRKLINILKISFWNKKQIKVIKHSGLFNSEWYLKTNPDVEKAKIDPLFHYVTNGAIEGRNPHPDFDSRFYLINYPEVKLSRINPLYHYIQYGQKDNLATNAWNSLQINTEEKKTENNTMTKIKETVKNLISYKIIYFSGLFLPTYYAEQNKDVVDANINPLWHFIKFGDMEGRKPNPLFDPTWYRSTYPDIAQNKNLNTLIHYYKFGFKEGRDPSSDFSTNNYLSKNQDVLKKGVNPLVHYLHSGIRENR